MPKRLNSRALWHGDVLWAAFTEHSRMGRRGEGDLATIIRERGTVNPKYAVWIYGQGRYGEGGKGYGWFASGAEAREFVKKRFGDGLEERYF